MLSILFKCISCGLGPQRSSFPLCETCFQSLVPCPRLCSCGSPICPETGCDRPWAQNAAIQSYRARYALIEPGYTVLKRWKKSGGRIFDRRILNPDSSILGSLKGFGLQVIVPIPQRVSRAWTLRGSPAEKIARWIGRKLDVPVSFLLKVDSRNSRFRQAELPIQERLANRFRFEVEQRLLSAAGSRVLLVDDFMTTGHTLRIAARALSTYGIHQIHVFCLGLRLQQPRLSHRKPRSVPVGEKTDSWDLWETHRLSDRGSF